MHISTRSLLISKRHGVCLVKGQRPPSRLRVELMTFTSSGFHTRPGRNHLIRSVPPASAEPRWPKRDALGLHERRALILEDDPRTATYVREVLERLNVQTAVARSLLEVGPHVTVPPPHLLVLNLPARDAQAHLEFASMLRASRGTACVFIVERLDREMALALAEIGEKNVLSKPVHREQLEATCLLALLQPSRNQGSHATASGTPAVRELHLEKTLRRIAEAVAVAGISPVETSYDAVTLPGLRPREEEIVRLLLQHVRVPAIAARLGIKQQTVRNHLKGAFKRTGVRSQQQLLDHFTRLAQGAAPPA
jgi:DNA-binding NarL/FixJ family response regulator